MRIGKIAATTLMAVAAVGIAAGTVNAQPTQHAEPTQQAAKEVSASGVEQGVSYHTVLSDRPVADDQAEGAEAEVSQAPTTTAAPEVTDPEIVQSAKVISTSVDGGRFELAEDRSKVTLRSDAGDFVAEVPLTFQVSGRNLAVAQQISDDGKSLALTPTMNAKDVGEMQPINSMDRLMVELNKNVVGIVAGGLIGGLIGTIIGVGFFSIITGPIGLVVGAIAGGLAMGGQPFIDAVTAVLTGQP
ncbi:hypothetical protein [Nocardia callitridis]|uniref:DUF8020 domain-containing protein n=1 Tax=Nocardia callitridis TaxID=648753 RepID=A0ABP9JUE0_9NOCA